MALLDNDIYMAELTLKLGTATQVLRVTANGPNGYTTGGGDTPAATKYISRLTHLLMPERRMFGDRMTRNDSATEPEISQGELDMWNDDSILDKYRRYAYDGASVVAYRGQPGAAYPASWTKVMAATMDPPSWDARTMRVTTRGSQSYAEVSVQPTLFAGSNVAPNGLEGTAADLKGKPKPWAVGRSWNVPLPCVNVDKQIYQFHIAAATVGAVRDGGVGLAPMFKFNVRTCFANALSLSAIASNGTGTVAATGNSGLGSPALGKSTDGGATWTDLHANLTGVIPGSSSGAGFVFAFGLWILSDDSGHIVTSPDLVTWTLRTLGFGGVAPKYPRTLCVGNGIVVAMGSYDQVAWTSDGTTWHYAPTGLSGTTPNWSCCARFNGKFWALSEDGRLAMAPEETGTGWQWITPGPFAGQTALPVSLIGINGRLASGAYRTGLTSPGIAETDDGVAWINLSSAAPASWNAVTYLFTPSFANAAMASSGAVAVQLGYATGTQNAMVGISTDGEAWGYYDLGTGTGAYAATYDVNHDTFVIVGASGGAGTIMSSTLDSFANTTDLQNDALAPAPGFYKVCPSAGYLRLGLTPAKTLTADVIEGATAADRTCARCFERTQLRAGLTAGAGLGNYSAADLTAADLLNSGEAGTYVGVDQPGKTCGELSELFARSMGAWWGEDRSGLVRFKRLDDPAVNHIVDGSKLNNAGWTAKTGTFTNDFAIYDGYSFSRLQGNGASTVLAQNVTLVGNGARAVEYRVRSNGTTGNNVVLFYDTTALLPLLYILETYNSDGSITFSILAPYGSNLRTWRLPDGSYHVYAISNSVTASHVNTFYASDMGGALGSGGVTDWLMTAVRIEDIGQAAVFVDGDFWGGVTPQPSGDPNGGIPPWRTVVRYATNAAKQTDFLDDASAASRLLYSLDWLEATFEDAAVLALHPLSQPLIIDSAFAFVADALAEATRVQGLLGVDPFWCDVGVWMNTTSIAVEIGDILDIVYYRYGLEVGKRVRVMGIRPEAKEGFDSELLFSVWAPQT